MAVLILHGINGYAGVHWQQWLQKELLKRGYSVIMPDLPNPEHPDRKTWLRIAKKVVKHVDPKELIVVGHSLGVVTALDLAESLDQPIKGLISVSGFSDDYGAQLNSYFIKEKKINFDKVKKHVGESSAIYGSDDPFVPQEKLKSLAENLETEPIVIAKAGHLNTEAGYIEFPLVLRIIENLNR